ncbi:Peroxidase 55 [Apostasia shenzhenica]|uniref:Peroxidase n=1 Tax=Apostasia shenzhenica TaxID=1088818 RepID=A0A2I0B7N0_9ASPA|nr:Peroxidase 55 [Apostasia shenzhenica]
MAMMVLVVMVKGGEAQLSQNFYKFRCPNVESIVRQAVTRKLRQTFVTVPATLRLFFHDCFVEVKGLVFKPRRSMTSALRPNFIEVLSLQIKQKGCDASVMIQSPSGNAEKDAGDNLSLAGDGFDTIVKAKQAVEASCPGVVSCADVMAIAARDVVALSGGPSFPVELGRRDGRVSQRWRVAGNLPGPDFSFNLLAWIFRKHNMSVADMVALSGGHTVGFSHCSRFSKRLYNFTAIHRVDPTMSPPYARQLMQECPRNVDPNIAVNMDQTTPNTFDNAYFKNLINGQGMFTSDQELFTNPMSRPIVANFASNEKSFFAAFGGAMIRLGRVGVKTGNQGEIRRDCTQFN